MPTLKMLPRNDIDIRRDPDGVHVYVALFENEGYLHYKKFPLSNFPNDFIGCDDLERFGIDVIDGRAV